MLNFEPGRLVCSLAGHDRGRYYIIINEEKDSVFVSDGRLKTVSDPKKKKKKHVQLMQETVLCGEFRRAEMPDDAMIRKVIAGYRREI